LLLSSLGRSSFTLFLSLCTHLILLLLSPSLPSLSFIQSAEQNETKISVCQKSFDSLAACRNGESSTLLSPLLLSPLTSLPLLEAAEPSVLPIPEVVTRIFDPDAVEHDKTVLGSTAMKVTPHIFDPEAVEHNRTNWADKIAESSPRIFTDNAEQKRSFLGEIFVKVAPQIFVKEDDDNDDNEQKKEEDSKKTENTTKK
jgi:hypothetical protein